MELTLRQEEIVSFIAPRHFASVAEISEHIYTSGATVRRELSALERMGIVKSVYGGVVLCEYSNESVPIYLRDNENSAEKERIAREASTLVHDGATVILDSSSTVRRICKHIKTRKSLTVITNNLRVCGELKDCDVRVICTGGTLVPKRECFVGHFAEEFMRRVNADLLFFSAQGLSENGDITDSSEEEIALRRVMLERSKTSVFLCDPSKVGKDYPFTLCSVGEIDKIIN
ncbi:MAG: DeoR/GlpR transcriptional regulator [Ruminococcaceae bacterium]|nr:DeoR/GlpR transcriptional regulator [Oscillospiraceae bacterium]